MKRADTFPWIAAMLLGAAASALVFWLTPWWLDALKAADEGEEPQPE